tara:strand:- start:648 stop:1643 length:996 start_codon:yes stop_codon:yes gene_type:complete
MKYKNYKKLTIISVLLFVLIYILYIDNNFHENILKNSIIDKNILNKTKENFSNYINVCKNGEVPQFYNLNTQLSSHTIYDDSSGCNALCDASENCVMYTLKDDECKLYSDHDTSINVQCANSKDTIIHERTYNGIGYVKNKYYNENANKFNHIDYLLKKSNAIIDNLREIKSHTNSITYDNANSNEDLIKNKYQQIGNIMNGVSGYYNDDINYSNSYNNLFTGLLQKSVTFGIPDNSINIMNEEYNFKQFYNVFDKLIKNNNNNDAKLESSDLEYNRRFLVYIILSFLLVITILILIFYIFAPKIISNLFMFFYFIGIILLTFFVHLILKQ